LFWWEIRSVRRRRISHSSVRMSLMEMRFIVVSRRFVQHSYVENVQKSFAGDSIFGRSWEISSDVVSGRLDHCVVDDFSIHGWEMSHRYWREIRSVVVRGKYVHLSFAGHWSNYLCKQLACMLVL